MLGTLPISIIWPLFAALGEEFGWRGFYLPRLQVRHTALGSSLIIAVAWGLWHFPTQVLAFRQYGMLVVLAHLFLDNVVVAGAMSTAMTWVHNNARQSMLLMVLYHYSITSTVQILSAVNMSVADGLCHGLVYAVIYWLVALAIIAVAGPKRLVREHR
jgi:membrane protease YdiL (CAAX protease family)